MKITRRMILAAGAAMFLTQPLAAAAQDLPHNIRMVIGSSSTGGDTYQNSVIVAEALSQKLGVNMKVDAVGANEAFKALERDGRGTTIMVFHDSAYLSHLYGVHGFDDIFTKYKIGPTVAINPGNAYLVAKDSPYKSMDDIFKAAAAGTKIRVAIEPGGVSEIGFSAMKNAASILSPGSEANIVSVKTGSQSDKNQAMFDDLADVINGSIQANEQFTQLPESDQKAMRFVWITARPETIEQAPDMGMGKTTRDDMLKYTSPKTNVTEDGKKDFTFDKEFFFLYNKDMDQGMVDAIDVALKDVFAEGKIQERQKQAFFIPNFKPSKEAAAHLGEKNAAYKEIIAKISGK
ncbi:ABC transporter substrate-binding protein [Mesorhizobium sp. BR1-1-13]|uniref:Bug family tripartite tricarboxylate transporter substrate binding protein n=1 Tax=Mesorhizobium sp. BR1-1-13 TaxID=2876656 RepID=UPI001CD0A128|nr:ABC transporter substrate-binding protein [Mesorhizobium sp. BR1-1-13]MBZ9944628.1 ABC transporter substrate-binding protein [Mesorhizobium sp. BR1-1-13]